MNAESLTKEFHTDVDDLIDKLLTSLKEHGWTLTKMQYQLSTLSAVKTEQENNQGQLQFELTAKWDEYSDAVSLSVAVQEPTNSWSA